MNNEEKINFNKLVIKMATGIFLALGLAVLLTEFWFYYENPTTGMLAIVLATLVVLLAVSVGVFLVYLKKKPNA